MMRTRITYARTHYAHTHIRTHTMHTVHAHMTYAPTNQHKHTLQPHAYIYIGTIRLTCIPTNLPPPTPPHPHPHPQSFPYPHSQFPYGSGYQPGMLNHRYANGYMHPLEPGYHGYQRGRYAPKETGGKVNSSAEVSA